jgi:GT2 family glycosyltransferase
VSGPTVDIGIPVFQRPEYVAAAIESVIAQSYTDWRLTISEELGPTPEVVRAVEPFLADERIRYVATDGRLGIARHKSSLVEQGQGPYVALLDDDDTWAPEWLERRVDFLGRHQQCVFVFGGHLDIDSGGHLLGRSAFPLTGPVHTSAEFLQQMMGRNFVATASVLVRRNAYRRAGTYDPEFVFASDAEMWFRLALHGPVGFIAVHDCSSRLHPKQISHRPERARSFLLLLERYDRSLAAAFPELRLRRSKLRRLRAGLLLSIALDETAAGRLSSAARTVVSAAHTDPRALASPRAAAATGAIVGGKRMRRRILALRPTR